MSELYLKSINFSIAGLRQHYLAGDFTPQQLVAELRRTILASDNPAFIYLLDEAELTPYFQKLATLDIKTSPLYGIPFAIKDNIDLAGIATTAACPDFSFVPEQNAYVVQNLLDAGALPLGKTNMDQFATGLVGVRSPEPWGPCYNTLNRDYISGGSSSGSAVAVANGWAVFSLGTDTAGSGRVPASLNNIVGLKPSCGLLSTTGVIPACRSLDCVSIFARTAAQANAVFDIAADYDITDPFSRQNPYKNSVRYFSESSTEAFSFGVPKASQLQFFGNEQASNLFATSVSQLVAIGGTAVEIDFEPFLHAAKLLYEGPWVTERYLVLSDLLKQSPESILPVIRAIVEPGGNNTAMSVYSAIYKLNLLKQQALEQLNLVDFVVTPTNGTAYKIGEVLADPIQLNSNLGYYTNFMNLLDFSALAVPSGFYESGVGFGITLFAKPFNDKYLLSLGARLQAAAKLPIGATSVPFESSGTLMAATPSSTVDVVVCGAHLDGLPLNWQLKERGAIKVAVTQSAPAYKLYALAGGPPFRPAMVRHDESGVSIEIEVWRVPSENFGSFVAEIPTPLGIGKVELNDGRWLPGFICEASGLLGATDITELGGWRAYLSR